MSKNGWIKNFRKTNLYRGLVDDVGPLLFLLGQNFENAWSGRLIDFIMESILEDGPIRLQYFSVHRLISPFGFSIPKASNGPENLDEKIKIASKIIEKSAHEPIKQKMQRLASDAQSPFDFYDVTPLKIHTHKIAYINSENCISLAKDPRVTVSLSVNCKPITIDSRDFDGKITLDLRALFPQLSALLEKFLKFSNKIEIFLKYQAWDHFFRPTSIDWQTSRELGTSSDRNIGEIIDFLPSHTLFFTTINLPWPEKFTVEGLAQFLEPTVSTSHPSSYKSVTLVTWKRPPVQKGSTHITALVIPDPNSEIDLLALPQIFSNKTPIEIKFDRVCTKYVVISPYVEALEELRETCAHKKPVLSHKHPGFLAAAKKNSAHGLLYIDFATFFIDAFQIGTERLKEKNYESPEVIETLKVLKDIPSYAYLGALEDKTFRFKEVP